MKTFYWHDYETWGANPAVDRPSQFAGIRTNEALDVVGDPLMIYCRPPIDIWPRPQASLITGITPQKAELEGLSEKEFITKINDELTQPQTCAVGYNSIRFDDEITRYTLFRNFFDPYEREWRGGNSRWDIIDMVRLVYALRPGSLTWPMIDGLPSFKLENLTAANSLGHDQAHDALSDVMATIDIARLIKEKEPALYEYVLQNKNKHSVSAMIDLRNRKPLFHISSKFGAARGCAALIAPLAQHPTNKNSIIVFDLSGDPELLATLSADEIRQRVFTKNEDLSPDQSRIPLKEVHLNKCPILTTTKLCDAKAASRLGIDKEQCEKNWHALLKIDVAAKLGEVFHRNGFAACNDPEQNLYNGFLHDQDKVLMQDFRSASAEEMTQRNFVFRDQRLNDIQLRYKARNMPEVLNEDEELLWKEFVSHRLRDGDHNILSYDAFIYEINEIINNKELNAREKNIGDALLAYADSHKKKYMCDG